MNENLITSAILAIIATISTFCAIYFLVIKNKPKRWKSDKNYVFCGRNHFGTITLSTFKTLNPTKDDYVKEEIYYSDGVDTTQLIMGKVYSFKRLDWSKEEKESNKEEKAPKKEGYNVRITNPFELVENTKVLEFKPPLKKLI